MLINRLLLVALCAGSFCAEGRQKGNATFVVPSIEKLTVEKTVAKADGNWRTYMGNESRSGVSSEGVSIRKTPSWTFSMLPPVPGFKPKLQNEKGESLLGQQGGKKAEPASRFDFASPVLIDGDKVYFGASTEESLYCVALKTGEILWSHRAEGSIRLSPTIVEDNIYFGSDDGFVYCLDKENGKEVWRFKADPTDRHIVANNRLSAQCPVRTSVTHADGALYFTAGMFPNSGGVHLYSVDAKTGEQRWKSELLTMAQGYILVQDGVVFVPTGRTSPIEYDATTGESLTLTKPVGRMDSGGSTFIRELYDMIVFGPTETGVMIVRVNKNKEVQKGFYDARSQPTITGDKAPLEGVRLLATDHSFYWLRDGVITSMPNGSLVESLKQSAANFSKRKGYGPSASLGGKGMLSRGDKITMAQIEAYKDWSVEVPDAVNMIVAGDTMYVGAKDNVYVVDLKTQEITTLTVQGTAWELSAGGKGLFVSTDAGKIYCFSADSANAQVASQTKELIPVSASIEKYAKDAVSFADTKKGYCVILGATDGTLGYALSLRTEMQIVYFVKSTNVAKEITDKYIKTGLYGERVTVRLIEGDELPYIKYFANLIVSEKGMTEEIPFKASEVGDILQPNGGALVLAGKSASLATSWKASIPTLEENAEYAVAIRGNLKDAGSWTHMLANTANTSTSGDGLVKGSKFEMQWFGYPYPNGHATGWHALSLGALYNKGVLLTIYLDHVVAVDAWNGTILWEKDVTGAVRFSPVREGGNCCMDDDYLYMTYDEECKVIDLKNGEDVKTITLPSAGDWGFIASYKKYLFGSSQPLKATSKVFDSKNDKAFWYGAEKTFVTSESLTVKSKDGFKNLWTYKKAGHSIVNSTITIADDKVFFVETALESGSHTLPVVKNNSPKLVALNIADQTPVWDEKEVTIPLQNVIYLGYANDALYFTGCTLEKEKNSKAQYHFQKLNAKTGELIWEKKNAAQGQGASHNEIVANPIILKEAIWCIPPSAKTTKISTKDGSTSGVPVGGRGKGCSLVAASNHISVYRSNKIGVTDFEKETNTAISLVNRPSCFLNLIPAGGMVLMPEGSLGCVCGFPYQGSMVLAPKE